MFGKIVAAVFAAVLPVSAAVAQEAPDAGSILPFDAVETTLPNGLKVIIVPTGFPNIVSLQIPVQTGARNEIEPGKSGFAHFFEHVMFRGTEKYSPDEYNAIITKAGARQNAYTADDYTNYHTTFAKEDLEKILEIEADRFQNLSYSEDLFKTEARAVLGEYNKNSANPIRKLYEVMRNAHFSTHTYKHTGMGFIEDIEDMPNQFDYSRVFFDRWYRPEYTTIIVAGDVDPERTLALIRKYWGTWKRGTYEADIPVEPPGTGPHYSHVEWNSPTPPWLAIGFRAPGFTTGIEKVAAMSMLTDLYFGSTSDIYKKLVVEEQKVDQMFAWPSSNHDPYLTMFFARVKDPKDVPYVRNEILRTVAEARGRVLPGSRLSDAKSNTRYGFLRTLDNTESIAFSLAEFVRYEREYETLDRFFDAIQALEPEDIQAIANEYFTDRNMTVVTLSQEALDASMKTAPAIASLAPAAPTADLDILVQKTELPQLNVKLVFDAGSAHDPEGKEGLAALSASMIVDAGSKSMTIDEINQKLFPVAGSFTALVDKEMSTLTGRIHRDNWQTFVGVALPMLLSPGYRQEDFTRVRDAQLNALTQDLRSNNEEELGKEYLQQIVFAGSDYEHPVLGTVAGIKAITLDDVRAFVAEHYVRNNMIAGISGAADDPVLTSLRTQLSQLPEGKKQPARAIEGNEPEDLQVRIIEKDTRATAISMGHPIEVTRSHPDFPALSVFRAFLGEHRSSMSFLYDRIREKRGMNYGDYAYIEAFPRGMYQVVPDANIARRSQIFEIWIRPVVPENAHFATRIALYELRRLIENGMTQQQFDNTRDYLMKNVYVMTATQDQQLGYALDSKWYGIPEFTTYMRNALSKLTLADVNAAIRRHISGDDMYIVYITKDAEGLRNQLIADEFSPIRYDAQQPDEILAEDKVIGAIRLGIKPANVRIVPVDQVFAD